MTYLLIYSTRCILIVLTVCYQDVNLTVCYQDVYLTFQEKLQPEATGLQPIIMKNDRDHGNLAKYFFGAQAFESQGRS